MVQHITAATSVHTNGTAFTGLNPDTLIVDADAYLLSEFGDGARLTGSWTVNINGQVEGFDHHWSGLRIIATGPSDFSKITIGVSGDLTCRDIIGGGGLFADEAIALTNKGSIAGNTAISVSGLANIANSGSITGTVRLSSFGDVFTDFIKHGHVIKSGTVAGLIDLGSGDDHFNGGANNEKVQDSDGTDTYKFGGGNDYYIATWGGTDVDIDIVNGGSGVDTYDASAANATVTITLGKFIDDPNAQGADVGFDAITGFENAIGGLGADVLIGSSGANTLIGGAGLDRIIGGGGRDILTGGADGDTFVFGKLSDSGVTARTRDVITDFNPSEDSIDLSFIDANSKHAGLDSFTFIDVQSFHHHAGELRVNYKNSDTIVSGDVNGDGKADFSILLQGHTLLHPSDFGLF